MNINSSTLLSLLAPIENQEGLRQPITEDESAAKAFTETLAETIKQIQGLGKAEVLKENGSQALSDSIRQLHQIAGIINQNKNNADISSFIGKNLPLDNKLEKQIDLEGTLTALANVMQTLEVSEPERLDPDNTGLDIKLNSILEKVDDLLGFSDVGDETAEQIKGLSAKLDQVKDVVLKHMDLPIKEQTQASELITERGPKKEKDGLSQLAEDKLSADILLKTDRPALGQDGVEKISIHALEKNQHKTDIRTKHNLDIQQMPGLEAPDLSEAPLTTRLIEHVESVVDAIKNLQKNISSKQPVQHANALNDRLAELVDDAVVLKEMLVSEKVSLNQNETETEAKASEQQLLVDDQDQDQELLIDEQILAIASSLESSLKDDEKSSSHLLSSAPLDVKKEPTTVKQLIDERLVALSGKQADSIIKQEQPAAINPAQGTTTLLQKQDDKLDQIDGKSIAHNDDKSALKFATEMSNLNRSFRLDSKIDTMPPMTRHFSHPEWNKEMAERVIWMHKKELPSAELRLNPRHLGPVAIKIDVANEQATVAFTAHHAAVKDAIESAIPKLREMFSAQQLNLAEVNVSQEEAGHRQSRGFAQWENAREESRRNGAGDMTGTETTPAQEMTEEIEAGRAIASNGILSLFA